MKPIALALLLALAGCATMRPTTDVDPAVDFSGYETFTWIDDNPLVRTDTQRPLSPFIEQRLMTAARSGLTERGLRFVEDPQAADLAVAFTIGSRQGLRVTEYPTTQWNHPWRGGWRDGMVRTTPYTEGQLAIDIFDVETSRPIWHGTVSRRLTGRERAEPGEVLENAVHAILRRFPAGSAAAGERAATTTPAAGAPAKASAARAERT